MSGMNNKCLMQQKASSMQMVSSRISGSEPHVGGETGPINQNVGEETNCRVTQDPRSPSPSVE